MNRIVRTCRPLLVPALLLAMAGSVRAEEAASGHYMPGATASFIDALPGKPGLALVSLGLAYIGSASTTFPIGGQLAAGVDASAYAENLAGFYQFDRDILGGQYVMGVVLPLLTMEVKGTLNTPLGNVKKVDNETGLGDMLFFPFMLGWTALGGDLKYDVRLGIYAPTGEYHVGKLANLGKNYWTFEPTATISWISSKIGLEVSAFTGFDINTENTATDYESGTSWHLEATVAQHLPLLGGFVGVGANAFVYTQITGDDGAGAVLGGFKGHTIGIGPVASYIYKGEKTTVAGEVKWLPEIDTDKRLQGDYFWLKLAVSF
jgi:hypothetical protein